MSRLSFFPTLLEALPGSFPHSFCVCLTQVHQGLNALRSLDTAQSQAPGHSSLHILILQLVQEAQKSLETVEQQV